jgi:cytochrome P450
VAAPASQPAPSWFDPRRFEADGYPWAEWARLRREEPVAWIDAAEHAPFWAITRHADVVRVSKDPETFRSAPGNVIPPRRLAGRLRLPLGTTLRAGWRTGVVFRPRVMCVVLEAALAARRARGPEGAFRNLLNLDPPEHRAFRHVLAGRFTARAVGAIEPRVERLARETVARVAARAADPRRADEPWDFVTELAARFPLAVIMDLLGCPAEDHDRVLRWSNAIVGSFDDEYGDAAAPFDAIEEARLGLFDYFARQVSRRRREPGDDLVSALVAARVGGRALTDFEVLSYCFLLALAGNETTRNAASGGMLALLERPAQLRRLRAEPGLLATAPDEIVRWSSPIVYFQRTAARDVELHGRRIRAGDRLALFYPSANRDEEVFPDANAFDLARSPNRHLGFGIGEHFCLGAHLARMELRAIFASIVRELPEVELAGPVVRLRSNFVGGIKHLPLRFARKESR